jgi:hypothetical protein
VKTSRPWTTQMAAVAAPMSSALSRASRPRRSRCAATSNGATSVESMTCGKRPRIAWSDGKARPTAKRGATTASAREPVASSASMAMPSGSRKRAVTTAGAIEAAGDGPPIHETTADIASKPGRALVKSVPSSGIGIRGSTSWLWAMLLASPPCAAVSQSGGRTWPCSARRNMAAPTPPASNAGIATHHGRASSLSPLPERRRRSPAAAVTNPMHGRTVRGSKGM